MPTAGYTAEPDYGSEWWGSGVANQHCTAVTMPEAGRITRIGVWLRGKDASCSFRGVVWNSTRNTVLGQTALQTASGAALAVGASLKYEAAVATPFDVAAGTIYVGFTRNPTGAMQFGFDNTGSHYDDDNGSSNPSGMSGESLALEPPDGRLRRLRGRLGDVRPPLGRVGQGRCRPGPALGRLVRRRARTCTSGAAGCG